MKTVRILGSKKAVPGSPITVPRIPSVLSVSLIKALGPRAALRPIGARRKGSRFKGWSAITTSMDTDRISEGDWFRWPVTGAWYRSP